MGANLKEVRLRIKSVQSTQQITKAMKLVAAAKLRKAQEAITSMRPYSEKLNAMLENIVSNVDMSELQINYGVEREVNQALLVVITSNRGLCGAFNSNVNKIAAKTIEEKYKAIYDAGNLTILPVGKKARDFFNKNYPNAKLNENYVELFNNLTFENTAQVAEVVMEGFDNEDFDSVHVAYGRFRNAAIQIPECNQFLPVPKVEVEQTESASTANADFIFEPGKEILLNQLFPSILKTQFHRFNLETNASEHGARMTAMDNATENANDLVKELKLTYNKARQEAITRELSEIVGGAAALES
ncbi:MAG: ATP synthase F1 subunit gamma [Saprospiraceae bacterium]